MPIGSEVGGPAGGGGEGFELRRGNLTEGPGDGLGDHAPLEGDRVDLAVPVDLDLAELAQGIDAGHAHLSNLLDEVFKSITPRCPWVHILAEVTDVPLLMQTSA